MELELSSEEVFEWVRWGAIQRNMRILGTLTNLYLKNERSFRLKDLPMILDNLIGLLPEKYEFLKEYLVSDVKLELTKKLSQI
jgi:aminoglycoside/choline kinase family phosphotransferase